MSAPARPAPLEIREGAWFVADAHYAWYNPSLYDVFLRMAEGPLPPQIFLMGDIFDLLFANAPNSIEPNRKMVDLLQRISRSTEMIYLEGNHDFGLAKLFGASMRVVPRRAQPLIARFGEQRVALHHGDVIQGAGYELYTALIRNPWVDRLLNRLDSRRKGAVIAWLEAYNRRKEPCYRIPEFEEMVARRLEKLAKRYDFDVWVEGHYHQDCSFVRNGRYYVNLPAFACQRSVAVVTERENGIGFVEKK